MYQLNLNFLTLCLIFYIYCFLGWCFESAYVSICSKKWVNRGFMKGPFLPIYGSGAVIILYSTIPVMESPVMVYAVSLVSATLLELVTGYAMEKFFKVRYWDYSERFLNFKGYICFRSSIVWGFMGLLVTYIVNEPVALFIDSIDTAMEAALTVVLTLIFAIDLVKSFKAAYDIREIIMSSSKIMAEISELKEEINMALAEKIDIAAEKREIAFAELRSKIEAALDRTEIDDILIEKIEELRKLNLEDYANALREKVMTAREKFNALSIKKDDLLRRNPTAKSNLLAEIKNNLRSRK